MFRRSAAFFALLLGLAVHPAAGFASKYEYWTGGGGDSLWSNPANWDGGVAPSNGDELDFNTTASTINDLTGLSVHSIRIAFSPQLSGNAIAVGAGGIDVSVEHSFTLSLDVTLTASQTWRFYDGGEVDLTGTISGDGDLVIDEGYALAAFSMNGHFNHHGDLTLRGGWYTLDNWNAFTGSLSIISTAQPDWYRPHMEILVRVMATGAIPPGAPLIFYSPLPESLHWKGIIYVTPLRALLDLGGQTVSVASLSGRGSIRNGKIKLISPPDTSIAAKLLNMTLDMTAGRQTITGNRELDFTYNAGESLTANVSGGTLHLASAPFKNPTTFNVTGGTLEMSVLSDPCYSCYPAPSSLTNLNLTSDAMFKVDLSTTIPSIPYVIADNISLGNSVLDLVLPSGPLDPNQVLIRNATGKPVNGTFAGLPEGAVFLAGGEYFRITYKGGRSYSDVVITAVPRIATTTTLTAMPNPALLGDSVVLAARVSPAAGAPIGTVTFYDGSALLGTSSVSPYGQATFILTSLPAGSHSLTAAYSGDGPILPSTSAAIPVAIKYPTHTTLATSPNPAAPWQLVMLTATVSSTKGMPPGEVYFFDSSTLLGRSPLNAAGNATLSTSTLSEGIHSIFARYNGTATYDRSAAAVVTQLVVPRTQVTLTATPSPAMAGQPVLLTAIVTSPTSEVMVTFSDGSTVLGTAMIDPAGCAVFHATLGAGTHNIIAMYGTTIATTSVEVSPARRRGAHH